MGLVEQVEAWGLVEQAEGPVHQAWGLVEQVEGLVEQAEGLVA